MLKMVPVKRKRNQKLVGKVIVSKNNNMTKEFENALNKAAEASGQGKAAQYVEDFKDGAMWMFNYLTSDNYHTMDELYYYRMLYNALWISDMDDLLKDIYHIQKSKRHSDGELCFDGEYFIVQATLPSGQISNHYEMKYWDLFHCKEVEIPEKWDGHTPEDVIKRFEKHLAMNI